MLGKERGRSSFTAPEHPALEGRLKQDRAVVIAGVLGVWAIAWTYVIYLSQTSSDAGMAAGMASANMEAWGAVDFGLMFLMWAVMMVGMMVPTAAPMILLFAAVNRKHRENQRPYVPTGVFVLGYVIVWATFAAGATVGNWGLHQASLLSSMMGESNNAYLGGGLLTAAGVFQWSRLKYVCLTHCRTPIGFLMSGWKEGTGGALRMGLEHGRFCLGCCWVLMGLLFVLGVMNLLWIAGLAAFVLAEKVAPAGAKVSKATGVVLVLWGGWTILNGVT